MRGYKIVCGPFFVSTLHVDLTMMQKRPMLSWILPLLLAAGCTTIPTADARRASAQTLASSRGWTLQTVSAGPFVLAAFLPPATTPVSQLTIYLEGDGMAWISPSRISGDPTPINPLALRLALAQPVGVAAYLGRPCQYVFTAGACEESFWTWRRFAPEVVLATNVAIDVVKKRFDARQLTLVGYSGGATVAMLIAARRSDVVRVVSVAGNLDHRTWSELHQIDPLRGSLNPADDTPSSQRFIQWHFAGEKDDVIPPQLVRDFAARYVAVKPTIRVMKGFDHHCCWAQAWPRLWNDVTSQP
jgi:hypothetical protein